MARPRKGDVLQWTDGSVWELISSPEINLSGAGRLTCRAKCVVSREKRYRVGTVHSVYFQKEDVEEAKWRYTEDSFVRFVKETIAESEEQV